DAVHGYRGVICRSRRRFQVRPMTPIGCYPAQIPGAPRAWRVGSWQEIPRTKGPTMSKDSEERRLSRREWAKKMRREAYERAKERRASDPKYLAMKEEAKKRRREASQVAKERRKAAAKKRKLAGKEREATEPVDRKSNT